MTIQAKIQNIKLPHCYDLSVVWELLNIDYGGSSYINNHTIYTNKRQCVCVCECVSVSQRVSVSPP